MTERVSVASSMRKKRALFLKACEKDRRKVEVLQSIYATSDMPEDEYIGHLQLIAEGDQ